MADVLDHEPGRTPRWVWGVLAVPAVVLVAWAVARSAAPTTPDALPAPSPSVVSSAAPSPGSASSACGDVDLPIVDAGVPPAGTGIRLLVGDRDVRLVDVDAGTTRVITSPAQLGRAQTVTALTHVGSRVVAVLNSACGAGGLGSGRIVVVDASTGRLTPAGRGDEILPGTPATVLEYDAPTNRWGVRRLAGGRPMPLPTDAPFPLAAAGASYLMTVTGPGGAPSIGVGDLRTGRLTRSFGSGTAVAASDRGVFWAAGDCSGERCLLAHTGLDGVTTAQPVRAQPWGGTVSPDGRWAAFRLPRTSGRLGGHPGPPSEVAVLDARTGSLRVLPGLVLPTKAQTTFAWSADSRWLAIGADLGTTPLLLIWHEGLDRPARVLLEPASGGTAGAPALAVLAPDS